jgi:hypothetical protein
MLERKFLGHLQKLTSQLVERGKDKLFVRSIYVVNGKLIFILGWLLGENLPNNKYSHFTILNRSSDIFAI